MRRILAAALLALCLQPLAVDAGMLRGVEKSFKRADGTSSRIDYGRGFIEATAVGTADLSKATSGLQAETVALRTARHLAYQSLAETLGELQVNATTDYKGMMAASDTLKVETRAFLQGARVVKDSVEWVQDPVIGRQVPKAVVTVVMPFGGESGLGKFVDRHVPKGNAESRPAREPPKTSPTGEKTPDLWVIDARHLPDFEAALYPQIRNESGAVVYDAGMLKGSAREENPSGLRYESDRDAALKSLFGANPVILEAKALAAPAKGVLVLSDEDAGKAAQADSRTSFMSRGRVLVLLNETP